MTARRPLRLDRPGDPYPVLLRRGLLADAGPSLRRLWGVREKTARRRVAVVTHRKLARLYGGLLLASLRRAGFDAVTLYVPEGERHKNLETVLRLYDDLIRHRLRREDGLLALGGGVVGDTAGFVAATYLRGIDYVQVPTSLIAQIDSALGGKVGVNHPRGKNLIGAVYRPRAVWIDPTVLKSLPPRQLRSGLFEMLKYGFIGVPSLFRQMERSPKSFRPEAARLDRAIAVSVRLKLDVVRKDEYERGPRRILNFGHTVGHGLEAAGDFRRLSHGEAVGWGMIAAARLARRHGFIHQGLLERMEAAVRGIGPLPRLAGLRVSSVMEAIDRDKKIGARGLRFVLPTSLGQVQVVEGLSRKEIRWAVRSLRIEE
ncbi:MAG: 3-dehydroquinate synthase [Acidobacteriota bacterium]